MDARLARHPAFPALVRDAAIERPFCSAYASARMSAFALWFNVSA